MTNFVWDGDSLFLTNESHRIRFYSGRRKAEVNGITVWLNQEPKGTPADGTWNIAAADLDFLRLSILPDREEKKANDLLIVVDPGHGGDDPGAPSAIEEWHEKDFTLAVAGLLGSSLTNAGFRVKYTRTNDTFRTLAQRTLFAKTEKADLFISLHANYASNKDAHGFETYVVPPSGFRGTMVGSRLCKWQRGNKNDFPNTLLAYSIQKEVVTSLTNRIDRGMRRQSFYVLREISCPAVLIEFGFLSNLSEAREMQSALWQSNHVAAVTRGIVSYAKKIAPLDLAVAAKRKADEKANAAWRAKLAAMAAKRRKDQIAKVSPARRPPADPRRDPQPAKPAIGALPAKSLAAPFPLAPFPQPAEQVKASPEHPAAGADVSPAPPKRPAPKRQISPFQADTLLEFYLNKESCDE